MSANDSSALPGSGTEIEKDEYEVRVTLTVVVKRRGARAGIQDEVDDVFRAVVLGARKAMPKTKYPQGTVTIGSIEGRAFDAKALRRRAARKRRTANV